MKSLLDALQEGRLVELPDTDKNRALEYLALLIEAVPDIGTSEDIVAAVKSRELEYNTGIGNGVACPHVRSSRGGELLCALGWSPSGIEYGASDGRKVHLVIMYYIPESYKNSYLKEISGLAKAIQKSRDVFDFNMASDIQGVRGKLLEWVELIMDEAVPDHKATMIKLDAKQATLDAAGKGASQDIIPFTLVTDSSSRQIILSQNIHLVDLFEKISGLHSKLRENSDSVIGGYRVIVRSATGFAGNRFIYDSIAIKIS